MGDTFFQGRKGQPVVIGGSYIFSNKNDGYISPTLIERFREESLCYENEVPECNANEAVPDKVEINGPEENGDIIVFSYNSDCNNKLILSPANTKTSKNSLSESLMKPKLENSVLHPYISPKRRDVINFFHSEIERKRTIKEDEEAELSEEGSYGSQQSIKSVAEPTSNSVTTDEKTENRDIISFSVSSNRTQVSRKEEQAKPIVKQSPYFSAKHADIVSFYHSQESLLKASKFKDIKFNVDELEGDGDCIVEKEAELELPSENNEIQINTDIKVFRNSEAGEKPRVHVTSTPLLPRQSCPGPLYIKQESFISFFNNENSFIEATSTFHTVGEVDDERESVNSSQSSTSEDTAEKDKDIKVFDNRFKNCRNQSIEDESESDDLTAENPVLVVTKEFPDIISFYTPNKQDTCIIRVSQDSVPEHEEEPLPRDIPSPLPEGLFEIKDGSYLDEKELDNLSQLIPLPSTCILASEDDLEFPGFAQELEDDYACSFHSSVVVEDSKSEDGKPVKTIQDIENLENIEKAIDMRDAIKNLPIDNIDVTADDVSELNYEDDFEIDDSTSSDSLVSESEGFIPTNKSEDLFRLDPYFEDDDSSLERFFDDNKSAEYNLRDEQQLENVLIPPQPERPTTAISPTITPELTAGGQEAQPKVTAKVLVVDVKLQEDDRPKSKKVRVNPPSLRQQNSLGKTLHILYFLVFSSRVIGLVLMLIRSDLQLNNRH